MSRMASFCVSPLYLGRDGPISEQKQNEQTQRVCRGAATENRCGIVLKAVSQQGSNNCKRVCGLNFFSTRIARQHVRRVITAGVHFPDCFDTRRHSLIRSVRMICVRSSDLVDASKPLPWHYSQWRTRVPNFFFDTFEEPYRQPV